MPRSRASGCAIWRAWAAYGLPRPAEPARASRALRDAALAPMRSASVPARRRAPDRPARAPERRPRGSTILGGVGGGVRPTRARRETTASPRVRLQDFPDPSTRRTLAADGGLRLRRTSRWSPPRTAGYQKIETEKGALDARCFHEGPAGGRGPLRPPDPPLEPEDEAVHLHGARRDLHHRFAADAAAARRGVRVRAEHRPAWRHRAVRRYEEAGAGGRRERGHTRRHAVRQPP